MNDFTAHCSWIQPSSPEVLLCLKANAAELSPGCQTAVQALPTTTATAPVSLPVEPAAPPVARPAPPPTRTPQQAARPAPLRAPAAAPAPATAAPRQPTPEQLSAIRAACRSEFISHCSGVQPGGAEALQCLERNSAQLSASCKSAVAAIATGAPTAAAAAGSTAAPAVAPLGPMPRLRLVQELAILRVCGADQRTLCAGIPPGGGRIVACLAQNASSLSPQCYGALTEARQ